MRERDRVCAAGQISTAAFGITESASMQSIARRTRTARLDTTGVIIIIIIMIMIIIASTRIGTPPFPIPSLGRVGRFSELLRASPSFSELLRASSRDAPLASGPAASRGAQHRHPPTGKGRTRTASGARSGDGHHRRASSISFYFSTLPRCRRPPCSR